LRCLLLGLWLHCCLYSLLPLPSWSVPAVLGLVLGACRAPLPVAAAVLLLGRLMGPPPWTLFPLSYNEGYYLPVSEFNWMAGLSLCLGGSYAWGRLSWSKSARGWLGWGLLTLLLALYPFRMLELSPNLLSKLDEPAAPGYSFDGIQQMAAFQRYQHGDNYFEANRQAFVNDGRGFAQGFPSLSLRSPLLFWVLGPLPTTSAVAWVAWALTALTATAVYHGSRRLGDPLLSLAGPCLILCLFAYVQSNYWLFIQDPWATQFLILGVWALMLWPKQPWAALLFTFAFAVREFDGLALVALLALFVWRRNKAGAGLALLGLILTIALYHYNRVECARVLGMEAVPLSKRVAYSPEFAFLCLRFGSTTVLGRDLLMPILSMVSILAPLKVRHAPVVLMLFHAVALLIIFCFLGNGGAYYSYNIMPLFGWGAAMLLAAQECPPQGGEA
jgi:hypothetical protein